MAKQRKDLKSKDTWNVEDLYSSFDEWNKDFNILKEDGSCSEINKYKALKNFTVDNMLDLFEHYFKKQRFIDKLYTYAHLRMDEDLRSNEAKHAYGMILTLAHDFEYATSWIEPKILELPESIFQKYLEDEKLKQYAFYLQKIYRLKPHTLSLKEEELLALSAKTLDANHKAFSAFTNADIKFPKIKDSLEKDHELTNGLYSNYMRENDRVLRKNAFQTLHNSYYEFENTLAELLQGEVLNHHYIATAKKYESCLEASLNGHNIERQVYYNLVSAARNNFPLLHRYIALRKKILNLDEMHIYDIYASLVEEIDLKWSYEKACQLVIDSVAPLGKEYQSILKKGLLEDRWVDPYETDKKRSGAYSSGCYDSMPYILLNFHGSLNDVLTLAHEAGHSMHSYLSRKNQPFHTSQYPIFVAEVASTFNEQLLLRHLLGQHQDCKTRMFLLNYKLEGIRATFFRQAMFAEFELNMHEYVEKQIPITPTLLKEKYLQLNKDYFGSDMIIDPEIAIEWARVPHFYYNFYVYQYSTGISAAYVLYKKALSSGDSLNKYLQFLKSGGSEFPLDLLRHAGVDMSEPKAVQAMFDEFESLLNEFQELALDEKDQVCSFEK